MDFNSMPTWTDSLVQFLKEVLLPFDMYRRVCALVDVYVHMQLRTDVHVYMCNHSCAFAPGCALHQNRQSNERAGAAHCHRTRRILLRAWTQRSFQRM
jgi:hypothetical protein